MSEQWEGISGFDDRFEVSDRGRVRRIYGNGLTALLSANTSNDSGRRTVSLIPNGSRKRRRRVVARLVCATFNGPPKDNFRDKVLHLDGDVLNDVPSNLVWVGWSQATQTGWERRRDKNE